MSTGKALFFGMVAAVLFFPLAAQSTDFTQSYKILPRVSSFVWGEAVSISGTTAIVGRDEVQDGRGVVEFYARHSSGSWSGNRVSASDATFQGYFGNSVSVSGNRAIVGAIGMRRGAGAAYIYESSSSGWTQAVKLSLGDGVDGDFFGRSVAISGDIAVVGAPNHGHLTDGVSTGKAYVYERDSSGSWSRTGVLAPSDGGDRDFFGGSVAVSGSTVVVGAQNEGETYFGAVYVYGKNSSGVWSQDQKLVAGDRDRYDNFGRSVAISGDTLVVGANEIVYGAGSAYVFRKSASSWTQAAKLTASDGAHRDYFGQSVAISGDTLLVGASRNSDGVGAVYVYGKNSSGVWSQDQKLVASDRPPGNRFGYSVAISGDRAIVGTNRGSYVFERAASSSLTADGLTEESQPELAGGCVVSGDGNSVPADALVALALLTLMPIFTAARKRLSG